MKALLEANNLTVGYKKGKTEIPIISGISQLQGASGKLIALIGMNGTGKSTLLRTLAGLQHPLAGEMHLSGVNSNKLSVVEKSKMLSVVLTHYAISGLLTVEELVQLGRYPYTNWSATLNASDLDFVQECLEKTGILHLRNKLFHELSDGQQQKSLIARALAQNTGIILLDEPTNHLDIKNKVDVLTLLKDQASHGKCIVFSTHDIQLSMKFVDEVWIIDQQGSFTSTSMDNPQAKNLIKDKLVPAEYKWLVDEL